MTWRKKWANTWEKVRYCSSACQKDKPTETDASLEAAIVDLLKTRAADATICPSEAARAVDATNWSDLMERARRAGRRLAADGLIVVTQGGRVIEAATARGPIRYRRGPGWRTGK
jgi:hypothetical protein